MGLSDGGGLITPGTHRLEVRALGTSSSLWWDGVLRVAVRDGFNATATKAGILFYPPADWISRFDNFLVKGTQPCVTGLGPSPINVDASGGNVSTSITAPSGCAWQADTDAPWLALPTVVNGTGSSAVNFSAPNNSGITRSGTIAIGGQAVLVD
jgi:hypothetical protein